MGSTQFTKAVVEGYGARVSLQTSDSAMLREVIAGLPSGWELSAGTDEADSLAASFTVAPHAEGYLISDAGGSQALCPDRALAVMMLGTMTRRAVGSHRHELLCVQAGAVAYEGVGILLPALPLAGTSTLLDALVRAGAEPYADEFAMLDEDGRLASSREFGSDASTPPPRVPLALVALAVYRPDAVWAPSRLTPAEGVIALMAYSAAAAERPSQTLGTLRRALERAPVLKGDRGDAEETARELLRGLSAGSAS